MTVIRTALHADFGLPASVNQFEHLQRAIRHGAQAANLLSGLHNSSELLSILPILVDDVT